LTQRKLQAQLGRESQDMSFAKKAGLDPGQSVCWKKELLAPATDFNAIV